MTSKRSRQLHLSPVIRQTAHQELATWGVVCLRLGQDWSPGHPGLWGAGLPRATGEPVAVPNKQCSSGGEVVGVEGAS